MVQLITLLLLVALLGILVLQNLTPVLGLVVLGQSTIMLPLSLWLLGAISLGVLCTLLIYQLVPQKRPYRPMGQRLSDPIAADSEPANRFVDNRFVDTTRDNPSGQFQQSVTSDPSRQNPYDADWENFKAPEQWDDWEQQQQAASNYSYENTAEDTFRGTVQDIESGWGDDGYESTYAYPREESEMGWEDRSPYDSDYVNRSERPASRTYQGGWLYNNNASETSPETTSKNPDEFEDSDFEELEDVYDANYRVIIPPYDANKD